VQSKQETIAWEARWATPVALATFLAVALIISPSFFSEVSGTGDAAVLRSTDAHSGSVVLAGLLQGLGFALLAIPLVYLFRVVRARSPRVLSQLIGLVVIAPLFLALSTGLSGFARGEAADQFVAGEAKSTLSPQEARKECDSDREDEGAKDFAAEYDAKPGKAALAACEERKIEDEEASNAIGEASLSSVAAGLGVAGGLGFVVALFYSCLWAMRTGILSRFWGSLGMALGVAALLGLVIFTLVWFVYFALLILNRIPGGKPPAWPAGEAIPWPTPGEKAAAELQGEDPSPELTDPTSEAPENGSDSPPRKRKHRD
jgi:hypothetical protein